MKKVWFQERKIKFSCHRKIQIACGLNGKSNLRNFFFAQPKYKCIHLQLNQNRFMILYGKMFHPSRHWSGGALKKGGRKSLFPPPAHFMSIEWKRNLWESGLMMKFWIKSSSWFWFDISNSSKFPCKSAQTRVNQITLFVFSSSFWT